MSRPDSHLFANGVKGQSQGLQVSMRLSSGAGKIAEEIMKGGGTSSIQMGMGNLSRGAEPFELLEGLSNKSWL